MRKSFLFSCAIAALAFMPSLVMAHQHHITDNYEQVAVVPADSGEVVQALTAGIWNSPVLVSTQILAPEVVDAHLATAGYTVGVAYNTGSACSLIGVQHKYATVTLVERQPSRIIVAYVRLYNQSCS